jgi:endogenous inhibitor of DNA gyrase (YacG/DUF329 family)
MPPRRTRRLEQPCPRCGKPLMMVEEGVVLDLSAYPVKWVPVRRYCSGGCLLTAADFSEEQRGSED